MDKKLSATLAQTAEWAHANEALQADSLSIAIELRQFQMPEGQPITTAYKQINAETLPQLSSKARNALLEVAKVLSRTTNNTWTYVFTCVESNAEGAGGLSLDHNRIQLLALSGKSGVDKFLKKVVGSYGNDFQESRLCGYTGLGWGKPQQQFLLVTVPLEDREKLERMAEQAGFKLSPTVPRDPVTNKQTHRTRFAEYPTALFNEDNLLYLARSQQEVTHAKPAAKQEVRAV